MLIIFTLHFRIGVILARWGLGLPCPFTAFSKGKVCNLNWLPQLVLSLRTCSSCLASLIEKTPSQRWSQKS